MFEVCAQIFCRPHALGARTGGRHLGAERSMSLASCGAIDKKPSVQEVDARRHRAVAPRWPQMAPHGA